MNLAAIQDEVRRQYLDDRLFFDLMKGADRFVQAYNTQAAVEPHLQLIVGQTVTQAAND